MSRGVKGEQGGYNGAAMDDDLLIDLILHGNEERNLEYKGPLAWNDANIKGKLCKSIMAMANMRDGGDLVIGVREKPKGHFTPVGLTTADADTFSQDEVAAFVSEYAAPFVEFTLRRVTHEKKKFVVMQVQEFLELPVVCRKDGPADLRRGAFYTRTRRIYETARVSSEAEMREIIDLSAEKSIRTLIKRGQLASLQATAPADADAQKFAKQLGKL